ncbi:arylsulfatase [Flavobacterium hiemivividum]|uniref:N-acetylgalactosamine-6-sulfatase n=1 Tax=Flavobacterium hiemivividum TaxID=2541734 RepID=A0A4R5CZR1_9FLAO|nr:arylsulfatase [Flavobacterium hiemivividum]TDE06226.1 N-acetylgalactosamine-6-sulfatase [Flavobacterium hiemivividum]
MNKIKAIIFCCLLSSSVLSQQKPNIIYIYADDLGYGELGSYGQMKIKTPNLDRMAKEGMRFTQHYSSSAVCAPARCMLMTGKHGGSSYIRGNYELGGFLDSEEKGQIPLKAEEFTVAELVKQKGYTTALVGKWGLGMNGTEGSPNAQGFDYYYGYLDQKQSHNYYPTHLWENEKWDTLNQPYINVHKILDPKTATDTDFDYFKGKVYAPEKMTEKALKFIDNNKENPFFLYLPYTIPHASLQAPEEWIKQYIGLFEEKPYYGQNGYASTKYPLSTYAAMISYLDAQVGIIMDRIKELGLDENTIIMFSSDNGTTFNGGVDAAFFNSVDNLKGLKMDLYEGGIREPFIARWPGKIRAGSTSDLISAQYDFFATIADLTNQKVKNTDGISFLPELLGNKSKQKKHEYLYFEYPEKGGQIAIRMGDWKGVKSNLKKNPNALWEIYNLRSDRNETVDVSNQNSKLVKRFEEILKKEHQTSAVKNWEFINTRNSKL